MTMSMAFLVVGDSAVKTLATSYSPFVLITFIGFTTVLTFGAIAQLSGKSLWDRRAFGKAALFRSIAEIAAALAMTLALSKSSISLVTMVIQTMPLLITIGAVIAFGEVVGLRRWAAILVGFFGVLLILGLGGGGTPSEWFFCAFGRHFQFHPRSGNASRTERDFDRSDRRLGRGCLGDWRFSCASDFGSPVAATAVCRHIAVSRLGDRTDGRRVLSVGSNAPWRCVGRGPIPLYPAAFWSFGWCSVFRRATDPKYGRRIRDRRWEWPVRLVARDKGAQVMR